MSENDNKSNGDLKIKLDKLLVEIEEKYGPVMLEELTARLEKTITEFNDDINNIFEESFSKNKTLSKIVSDSINSGSPPDLSDISKEDYNAPKYLTKQKTKNNNLDAKNSIKEETNIKKKKRRSLFSRKK